MMRILVTFIDICVIIIFLSAGVLKILDGPGETQPLGVIVVSPMLLAVIAELEIVVGIWMLSGYRKPLAQVCALALMLLFAVTSLYRFSLWGGGKYCGCMGSGKLLQIRTRTSVMLVLSQILSFLLSASLFTTRARSGANSPQ